MAAGLQMAGFDAAPHVIFSMLGFVTTVLLVTPETALSIAQWIGGLCAQLFFPDDHYSKPPLSYRLARRYREEHRWEDAIRQYRKIIRYYPNERDAYLELLHVASEMEDKELYQKYAKLLRQRFKQESTEPI
jgi:tetratricopeptide (TPR) repeat protein